MPLHFSEDELASRRSAARAAMRAAGLDGLLMFRQESQYYLTGYDTFGYVHFQCLYMGADGRLMLLTRAPDVRQARWTSMIEDVRVWVDGADADPVRELRDILAELGCKALRLGVEWGAFGLDARKGFQLARGLEGFCTLEDATDLVSGLRVVKSDAELAYARRAAALADDALEAAIQETKSGAFEGDILAAMQSRIYSGGGDDPANEQIIGSGEGAMMCRYFTGRRRIATRDQLTLEFAGVYRHYHACLMRTLVIGTPSPEQASMHAAAKDALLAAEAALRPGEPIGAVFDAHARVLDQAGHAANRMNACGYAVGCSFAPSWMDWPMLYHGNPVVAEPGMVFFLHIIVFDSPRGLAMTLGRTVVVTETCPEALSKASIDLVVR